MPVHGQHGSVSAFHPSKEGRNASLPRSAAWEAASPPACEGNTSPGCDFAGMFAMQDQLLTSLRHWEGHPQDVSEKPVKSSTSAGVHMAMYIHMHTALTVLNAVPSTRNLIQSLPEAKKLKTL